MAELRKVRDGNSKFDMLIPDDIQEIFTDGVFQTMVGFPNSKLVFFTVSAASTEDQMKEGVESRKAVFEISIPTLALMELAQTTLASIHANRNVISSGMEKYNSTFSEALKKITSE